MTVQRATYAITAVSGLVVYHDGEPVLTVPPERLVDLASQALKAHTEWLARRDTREVAR